MLDTFDKSVSITSRIGLGNTSYFKSFSKKCSKSRAVVLMPAAIEGVWRGDQVVEVLQPTVSAC